MSSTLRLRRSLSKLNCRAAGAFTDGENAPPVPQRPENVSGVHKALPELPPSSADGGVSKAEPVGNPGPIIEQAKLAQMFNEMDNSKVSWKIPAFSLMKQEYSHWSIARVCAEQLLSYKTAITPCSTQEAKIRGERNHAF